MAYVEFFGSCAIDGPQATFTLVYKPRILEACRAIDKPSSLATSPVGAIPSSITICD